MHDDDRRRFLRGAPIAGLLLVGCAKTASPRSAANGHGDGDGDHDKAPGDDAEDVAPPEDLMREHGALNRILLVYEECARRLASSSEPLPLEPLTVAAGLIRRFIEDYHEKLEEDFLFPRFEKAGKLVDLIATLRKQHQAGRTATEQIQRLATPAAMQNDTGKTALIATIKSFVRMYRPHEAREDTVLFPALRSVVSAKEFHALGEQFEDKEHALFGKEGFEGIVVQIAKIEETLAIADLNQFTP